MPIPSIEFAVRASLAHHVQRGTTPTHQPLEPADETELTPLEIILVALDIEQSTAREWPLEQLATVRTVGELVAFFSGDAFEHVVVHSLAQYVRLEPDAIDLSTDLRCDLGLTTFDLGLVLLRLEQIGRVEFPSGTIALVRSVGDIVRLFRAMAHEPVTNGPGDAFGIATDEQVTASGFGRN
jgi:hypothetical protein